MTETELKLSAIWLVLCLLALVIAWAFVRGDLRS
jgi:hypothetical protein